MVKKENFAKELIDSFEKDDFSKGTSVSSEKKTAGNSQKKFPKINSPTGKSKIISGKIRNKKAKSKFSGKKKKSKKKSAPNPKNIPSLNLKTESEIAMDFAVKAYKKFDKIIKSIVLFGSTVKKESTTGSDIDIILIIDDASIIWDQKLIAWYRDGLEKLLRANPYRKSLHINTVKLSTWWEDLMRGDPVVLNILRYGEPMLDLAGFFEPLKFLMLNGKIKATPESIYSCLQRAPMHITRSKTAELSSIEGLYWAMVDSAHAALIAEGITPPSPEHIPIELKEIFVDKNRLKIDYVKWYRDLLALHKEISHGNITDLKGVEIDMWQERAEKFLGIMAKLVNETLGN